MRQALRDEQQPVTPPADPPRPRLWRRQEVPHLQQDVRQHAGPVHARADPQPQPQVRGVRQGVLAAVAVAGPPPQPHRPQAVRMRPLRQELRGPVQPARPYANPLSFQELQVQALRQVVRPQVLPEQAPGVGLLQGHQQ